MSVDLSCCVILKKGRGVVREGFFYECFACVDNVCFDEILLFERIFVFRVSVTV